MGAGSTPAPAVVSVASERSMRMARLIVLVLALSAVVRGDALAAGSPQSGVLSITPARRSITARPPVRLTPTVVRNTTPLDMKVTVFSTLLTQDLDGSFSFQENTRDLNAARLIFGAQPVKFTLKPGQAQTLSLRWNLLPRGARAAYIGLVVQGVPSSNGKGVGSILRLLGINFFKLPGRFVEAGTITQIRGEQDGPQQLRFFPRVKNTGQIHASPQNGHCVIRTLPAGATRFQGKFGPGVVLPGYSREFPVIVKKPDLLPAGSYRIRCSMRFGGKPSTASHDFRLSAVNTLPTASLKLTSVKGAGEIGSAADVAVAFRNRGSKESPAVLKVTLQQLPPGKPPVTVAKTRVAEGTLAAGASRDVTIHIGKLVKSPYRAVVVLNDGTSDVDQASSDFAPKPHRGFLEQIWSWLLWVLVILAVLALLLFLWRQRRRRRELEEELEMARMGGAPEPPPAPPAAAPPAPPAAPPPPPAAPPPPRARGGAGDGAECPPRGRGDTPTDWGRTYGYGDRTYGYRTTPAATRAGAGARAGSRTVRWRRAGQHQHGPGRGAHAAAGARTARGPADRRAPRRARPVCVARGPARGRGLPRGAHPAHRGQRRSLSQRSGTIVTISTPFSRVRVTETGIVLALVLMVPSAATERPNCGPTTPPTT